MKAVFMAGMLLGFFLVGGEPWVSADTLKLKNGQGIDGKIVAVDGKSLVVEASAGGGTARIPYPLDLVDVVEFERTPEERVIIESGDASRLADLEKIWETASPFLSIPHSDSGEIGLKLVRVYLAAGTKKGGGLAVKVCELVLASDWDGMRKTEAQRLRLSALAASGKIEQAMQEAEQLETLSGADDEALAMARVRASFVKADLAWNKLKALEEEWPKWVLMPDMAREHRQLFNDALDRYLFPVVFHAELKQLCAEGLWKAAELYNRAGSQEEARRCAKEILDYYPEPEFAARAEAFLKKKPDKKT